MAPPLARAGAAARRTSMKSQDMTMVATTSLKNNFQALGFLRNFVAIVIGIAAGILGVTGWHGFLYHLASQLLVCHGIILCAAAMISKGCTNPPAYFLTWNNLLTSQVLSSITLLSYILFWMIFYNLCHVF